MFRRLTRMVTATAAPAPPVVASATTSVIYPTGNMVWAGAMGSIYAGTDNLIAICARPVDGIAPCEYAEYL